MSKDIQQDAPKGERIAKFMARAGLCSRREAERWIEKGRVQVNGQKLTSPACVVTDKDEVIVDGKKIGAAQDTRLFMFHKTTGVITSNKDPEGRPTIFDRLPDNIPRLVTVGRLDMNTEGLLLLTNDGELSRYLELPATGWKRKYRVRVHGRVDDKKLAILKKGLTHEGVRYKPIIAELESQNGTNSWLSVTLTEGKNREVRRAMDAVGLTVNRLIRVSYGPFNLGNMPKNAIEEVKPSVMKQQIPAYFKSGKSG
ncbi:MAG: pseudouridine synthase [Alphaproteobacteria bacterium]|nr:pseudouridine synthase [Alphaproteobacteria bacterium]|tara:strand:- start:2083 stop:2847 length:765 start_codon:yes stop_codon:yes gene_type:complete